MSAVVSRGLRQGTHLLLGVVLVIGGCAGKSSSHDDDGGTSGTSGTRATGATGGSAPASGGSGGSVGGTANEGAGAGNAGIGAVAKGGTGGAELGGTSGTGAMPNCGGVLCAPLPTTCKKIVQPPDECCPICPDTGCGTCDKLSCEDGEHLETIAGDCCPSCVADPPDLCEQGQATYAAQRDALLEKYRSSGCGNSADCTIVYEYNACASTCGEVIPSANASNFTSNLESAAMGCATCDPPRAIPCPAVSAACVNGKCVTAGP